MPDVFPADILRGSDPWILAGMHWLAHFFWKHISREMGTCSVISCHILLCAWLKNNCQFLVFIVTAFAILWGDFCYFLRNSPFKVGKNGLQISLHLGNDDSLPCFTSQPLDTNQNLEKSLSCSLDSWKLDSIKISECGQNKRQKCCVPSDLM